MKTYPVRTIARLSAAILAVLCLPPLHAAFAADDLAPAAQSAPKIVPFPKNVMNADSVLGADSGLQDTPADANQFDVGKSPDPRKVPVMAEIVKDPSLHVFSLGHIYGTDGWFTVNDKKQIQVFYTMPDGHGMIIGALFDAQGNNITAQQIVALRDRDAYVKSLFSEAAQNVAQAYKDRMGSAGAGPTTDPQMLGAGERLMKELLVSNWVGIGNAKAAPLYMVIDPRCPHCKNAFKMLADQVGAGKIQVRLLPVDILGGDSRILSADLVASSDPAAVWQKMIAGDLASLERESPGEDALEKVDFNRSIFDRWKMPATPYLVYRGRDGKVKILEGEPQDAAALASDISN